LLMSHKGLFWIGSIRDDFNWSVFTV